jgi:hypothetical protein
MTLLNDVARCAGNGCALCGECARRDAWLDDQAAGSERVLMIAPAAYREARGEFDWCHNLIERSKARAA